MSRENIKAVLEEVKERVTPSLAERKRAGKIVAKLIVYTYKAIREEGLGGLVRPEVEGSYAKDTWLSGELDIDMFLLFNYGSLSLEYMKEVGLRIAYRVAELLGVEAHEMYATHPYLRLTYSGIEVDLVPAYSAPSPSDCLTPVDRTPFHTRYVLSRIASNPSLRDEIRLFKKFLKGIGVYGAEVKVGGFSGYLAELITIYAGSFLDAIKLVASWRPRRVALDIEGYYSKGELAKLLRIARSPILVIDPVDKHRNVAAAVTEEKLSMLIAAAKEFLANPSTCFFYPKAPRVDIKRLREMLSRRAIIAIKLARPQVVEEVLWGQAKRALRAIVNVVNRYGFTVYSSSIWVSSRELIFLIELEALTLPVVERHEGPPVYSPHAARFLRKYARAELTVSGPYIEGSRWIVLRRRRYSEATRMLKEVLPRLELASHIKRSIGRGFDIYAGEEVLSASSEKDFLAHLYTWLVRKMPWSWS